MSQMGRPLAYTAWARPSAMLRTAVVRRSDQHPAAWRSMPRTHVGQNQPVTHVGFGARRNTAAKRNAQTAAGAAAILRSAPATNSRTSSEGSAAICGNDIDVPTDRAVSRPR